MEKSKRKSGRTDEKPMRRLIKKLGSSSGETIAETLVSLLIAALALTMLAGAMSSSFRMVTKSRNKLNEYNEKTESMVKMDGAGNSGSGAITITAGSSGAASPDISLNLPEYQVQYAYNNEFNSTPVAVYKYLTPTPGG